MCLLGCYHEVRWLSRFWSNVKPIFFNSMGYGGWSTNGIDVISNTSIVSSDNYAQSIVSCKIYHQTPFTVLVDVHGVKVCHVHYQNSAFTSIFFIKYNPGEEYALEIVGYVGVSLSILFLILTILLLMLLGWANALIIPSCVSYDALKHLYRLHNFTERNKPPANLVCTSANNK